MEDKVKISVIVPLYNAEKYLHRFFESLLRQTFKQFDAIIVDDGSTDKSNEICCEYAHKDNRIRIYSKENGGLCSARNFGIEKLKQDGGGKYIIFVDPDDWYEPSMLEQMYKCIVESGAEMLMCDYYNDYGGKTSKVQLSLKSNNPDYVLSKLLLGMHSGLWKILFQFSIYADSHIMFPNKLSYQDDSYILMCILPKISKVAYLPQAFYHYCIYPNSLSHNLSPSYFFNSRMFLLQLVHKNCHDVSTKWEYMVWERDIAYQMLLKDCISDEDFRELFKLIKPFLLLHPHKNFRRSVLVCLVIARLFSQKSIRKFTRLLQRR